MHRLDQATMRGADGGNIGVDVNPQYRARLRFAADPARLGAQPQPERRYHSGDQNKLEHRSGRGQRHRRFGELQSGQHLAHLLARGDMGQTHRAELVAIEHGQTGREQFAVDHPLR